MIGAAAAALIGSLVFVRFCLGGGSLKVAGAHALDAAKTWYGSNPMTGGILPVYRQPLFALYSLVLLYASFYAGVAPLVIIVLRYCGLHIHTRVAVRPI